MNDKNAAPERMKCVVEQGYVKPCSYLEDALDERSIMLRSMCNMVTGKESGTMLFCSTGNYRKKQMGMLFCPFCGEGIHKSVVRAAMQPVPSESDEAVAHAHAHALKPNYTDVASVVEQGWEMWAMKTHNKKWVKMIARTPIPNDVRVNITENLVHYINGLIDRHRLR